VTLGEPVAAARSRGRARLEAMKEAFMAGLEAKDTA